MRSQLESQTRERIRLNIGGVLHDTWTTTLSRIPGTRLALLARLGSSDETWDSQKREYFFDHHPMAFTSILQYYRVGEFHPDQNICGNVMKTKSQCFDGTTDVIISCAQTLPTQLDLLFQELRQFPELEFWGLTEVDIESCCWGHYSKFKDHRDTLRALDDNVSGMIDEDDYANKSGRFKHICIKAWRFLEEPTSSRMAKVYAVMSMFFVLLAIAVFCTETHYLFRVPKEGAIVPIENTTMTTHHTRGDGSSCCCTKPASYPIVDYTEPHLALTILDYICAVYFTVELVSRFAVAPRKLEFAKAPLNIIDLLCLIPHIIAIALRTLDPGNSTTSLFKSLLSLRTIRVLRIFKLMKHYSAFKILVYTIKVSSKELLLIIVFLFTGVLIFASIIYYVENPPFDSIPRGFWWALVTMTTVGYGDYVPMSEGGYVIGSVCVICGVLTIAFTVPIVVNNFTLYYAHAQSRIKLPLSQRKEIKKRLLNKSQKVTHHLAKIVAFTACEVSQLHQRSTPGTPDNCTTERETDGGLINVKEFSDKQKDASFISNRNDDISTTISVEPRENREVPLTSIVDDFGLNSDNHNETHSSLSPTDINIQHVTTQNYISTEQLMEAADEREQKIHEERLRQNEQVQKRCEDIRSRTGNRDSFSSTPDSDFLEYRPSENKMANESMDATDSKQEDHVHTNNCDNACYIVD